MKIRYGNVEILCDSCIETDGKWTLYQGGVPIKQISNIPDPEMIEVEGGEVEHEQTPFERLQAEHEEIKALILGLGEAPTAAKLKTFLADLKDIIEEGKYNGTA